MPHQELYHNYFDNAGLDDRKTFLENIVRDYPFFGIAHFYLLKETAPTDAGYKQIAARTALHYNNAYLLNFQLNRKKTAFSPYVTSLGDQSTPLIEVEEELIRTQSGTSTTQEGDVREAAASAQPEMLEEVAEKTEEASIEAVSPGSETMLEPPAKKEELLFEPLHTTDYFASQGIKLSEEMQSSDKLGKQLKSFTDWLKTMKKVHQGKLPETGGSLDVTVQQLAEKSNKEQEVITEAMAEVFVGQGKKAKAVEIYRKLSLLDPSKNAYFAAKIELLKEN